MIVINISSNSTNDNGSNDSRNVTNDDDDNDDNSNEGGVKGRRPTPIRDSEDAVCTSLRIILRFFNKCQV